ncbi:hypothetical protein ACIBF5_03395 [Micromonospora sp. NPDC050417]|uniref:hypothetical protein n=1 Tax=Micromonospora sp. NPDC050417 TaxID=3364280 RepID=UPI0037A0831F
MDYRDWGRGESTRPVRRPADAWVDDGDPRPGDPHSHTGEGYQPPGRDRGARRSDPDRYTPTWARESSSPDRDESGRHRDDDERAPRWSDTPRGVDLPLTKAPRTNGRDSGGPATDYWTAPTGWSDTEPTTTGRRRRAETEAAQERPRGTGRHADNLDGRSGDRRTGQEDGYAQRRGPATDTGRTWADRSDDGARSESTRTGGSSSGGRRRSDRRDRDRSDNRPADRRDDLTDTGRWSTSEARGTGRGSTGEAGGTGRWNTGEAESAGPRSGSEGTGSRQWSRTGRPRRDDRTAETGRWDQFTDTGVWHWGSEDRPEPPPEPTPGRGGARRAEPDRRADRRERGGRAEWSGPRTTAGTGDPVTGRRGQRPAPDPERGTAARSDEGARSTRDRSRRGRTTDQSAAGGRATGADPATGGRSRDRFTETGQWNRVTEVGEGHRHQTSDTGQWDRITDTGQWDRLDETDRPDREAEPRVWSSFTDTGQWDRFTDTGVWDRSELDALDEQERRAGGPSWRDRGSDFWSGARLADDDPRWMETPTSAPRSPAVAYPRPPRIRPPDDPTPTTTGSRVAAMPAEPRISRSKRGGPSVSQVTRSSRTTPGGTPDPAVPPSRSSRRLEEDLLDTEPGTHLAAVLYTAAWYAVPVLVFFIWLVTLDNSPPPGCVTDPAGGGCDSDRAQALTSILGAAPRFGAALMGSLVVALLLRWVSKAWRPASLGLASAVVGGGLSTVLYSVITGQPLG